MLRRFALLLPLLVPQAAGQETDTAPPSRALLLELCASTRLAGTPTSRRGAEFVARVLEQAGWRVEFDEREVLLSLPRSLSISAYGNASTDQAAWTWARSFDPDARPADDLPLFNAWSASGDVRGPVVDVGRGLRADFEALGAEGIELRGAIALCRYGGAYRGIKAQLAQEYGCAGLLLFTDPAEAGAERGPVWPDGPWMPGHEAQRGSIAPMAQYPGDPSSPGFASPAPDQAPPGGRERLRGEALEAALPAIPCLPIGADHAAALLGELRARRMAGPDGRRSSRPVGPGPVEVHMHVDAPRELRTIVNVLGWLDGGRGLVIAGNHRDAWVRGAHDAGSGTVSLLRAAQHLGARAKDGWRPKQTLGLAFWDAEESGLIGSTEWGEANAPRLRSELSLYINADAAVSGPDFGISGTPGLERLVEQALDLTELAEGGTLRALALPGGGALKPFGLPGSGSDYTVFLHHLTSPILDLGFRGNRGGQYHTAFDDFEFVERHMDPGFVGHERCGSFVAQLMALAAEQGRGGFRDHDAADTLAAHARESADALGTEAAAALADSLAELGAAAAAADREAGALPPTLLRGLRHPQGLPNRPWFRIRLWAPGIEKGYGADTFPELRAARLAGDEEGFELALEGLLSAIDELTAAWTALPPRAHQPTGGTQPFGNEPGGTDR